MNIPEPGPKRTEWLRSRIYLETIRDANADSPPCEVCHEIWNEEDLQTEMEECDFPDCPLKEFLFQT